jgi:glutaconate CoA-transferase subunit B
VITTLAVLRFDPATGEMVLASIHPGVTVKDVQDHTGWPLRCADRVPVTAAPTAEELAVIRRFDPEGFWTRGGS